MSENRTRRILLLLLKLAVAAGALGWTLSRVPLDDVWSAAQKVTAVAFAIAVGLSFLNLVVGAARWRVLLQAYGSTRRPPLLYLSRVYLVGLFYNTFIPGNVGGDVLRGYVTRSSLEGATGAYVVVAVERVFGLAGLLLLGATVTLIHPVGSTDVLPVLAAGGLAAALVAVGAVAGAAKLAPWLPARLGELARSLPRIQSPALLLVVLAASVGTQTVVALTGHVLIHSVDPSVSVAHSLVLVPLAMIAIYFPATVAGLGAREAAFVLMFEQVGVSSADATAASIAFLAVQLLVAAVGGLAHLLSPLKAW